MRGRLIGCGYRLGSCGQTGPRPQRILGGDGLRLIALSEDQGGRERLIHMNASDDDTSNPLSYVSGVRVHVTLILRQSQCSMQACTQELGQERRIRLLLLQQYAPPTKPPKVRFVSGLASPGGACR